MRVSRPKNGEMPPPPRMRTRAWRYPFPDLEVGQHFDVVIEGGEDLQKTYSRVHSSAMGFRRRHGMEKRYRITCWDDRTVRAWRLEDHGDEEAAAMIWKNRP